MNDRNYIDETITKLKNALAMHRAREFETIMSTLRANGITLVKDGNYCQQQVRWTDDNGNVRSFFIEGYKRPSQHLKTREISLEGEISDEAKKAFAIFENDQAMIDQLSTFMSLTDMVDVKRALPELKPFMTLVEKDRKEAKEKENAEWRRTYEICIELFGDEARG